MSNRRFATALASGLADLGVEHAVVSPGSRNTPLLAGFAAETRITKWPFIDERVAGFFATGLAKTTGRPIVLVSTSGTAAAEYHPAVIEASHSDVPLIVLTADRPEELRGVGAPQTIDQISLYGTAVRMFADALVPELETSVASALDIAFDAWAHATAVPSGPVHINLPFREPLLDEPRAHFTPALTPIGDDAPVPDLSIVASRLAGRRSLIVAGRSNDPEFAAACARLARRLSAPILADPLSGLRFGGHSLELVLSSGDQLAAAGALDLLRPEIVLRFGPVPTSKPVWTWLQTNPDVEQILVDVQSRDATGSASTVLEIPETAAASALGEVTAGTPSPEEWGSSWMHLDKEVSDRIAEYLTTADFPNEPEIARIVANSVPDGSILTIGSSMPVRDVDAFGGKAIKDMRVFGNRGANGIDGVVSAALGIAATGVHSTVLVGDVSMLHDIGSLAAAALLSLPLTIAVVNNNGGGIFHFLPQADPGVLPDDTFEEYLAMPHGTDFVQVARSFGIEAHNIVDRDHLSAMIGSDTRAPRLLQIRTERQANLEIHNAIAAEVRRLVR